MKSLTHDCRNGLLAVAACVLLLLSFPASVCAQDEGSQADAEFEEQLEQTSQLIVMVTVEFSGIPEYGAGIIFGREKDRLLIATAYHVIHRGAAHPPVRVRLKSMPDKLLHATVLKFDARTDLAVLSVEKQGINVCALPFDRLGDAAQMERKDEVSAVGNPNGVPWAMPVEPDKISQVTPKEIVFQSTFISKGHSGGALLDDNAALVGMILADQPPFGRAMRMDGLLQLVREWGYPVQLYAALEDERTPLHEAAKEGDVVAIKKLLADCANPNAEDQRGETPLHLAAAEGQIEAMLVLLKAGADINAAALGGGTPLVSAIWNHIESVRLLVKAGAKVNSKDSRDTTPLHQAIYRSVDIVEILVTAGADVNALDGMHRTPLSLSAEFNRSPDDKLKGQEIMRLLMAAGAKIDADIWLYLEGHGIEDEVLTILLKAVTNPSARVNEGEDEETLLHVTARDGKLEMVKFLVKAGVDVNSLGRDGQTPLFLAILRDETAVQDFLIGHGARIKSGNKELMEKQLWKAVQNRRLEVAKLLAAELGQTTALLHEAIEKEDMEMVNLLIKAGADINAKVEGETPLQRARRKGQAAIEKVLLAAGAKSLP